MVWYATREDVKNAADVAETARNDAQVDRAIETASRAVESLTLRKFYPTVATRYFDWPDRNGARPWRLWLNGDELISVTSLVVAGETIDPADYLLEPANSGPPYTHLEIDLSSSAGFSSGSTHQRAVAVTGVFGYRLDSESVGALSANLDADAADTATVTWTKNVGVGDLLTIGTERLVVSSRALVDTTQNLQAGMSTSKADVTVAVTDGTAFLVGHIILVDAERMLVVDIAGNNLIVKRAWDGSVLADHTTGADVYALTGVAVDRAQLGTTLGAHLSGATITRQLYPGPIRSLCVAEAINQLQQEAGAYGRSGSGESERPAPGVDLPGLRAEVRTQYGRRNRIGAV